MCCYMGLLIYASYYKCDPVTRGAIHKSDQLLPYFVMQIAGSMIGLPGLFVSGVFSAALRFLQPENECNYLIIFISVQCQLV